MYNVELLINNAANYHIYIACTGAGASIPLELWYIPGASSTLVGSSFTYAAHETDEFLGFKPESYCDKDTALEMAMVSYIRACEYELLNKNYGFPIGMGLTASVASTRIHRGDHRIFLACMTPMGMFYGHRILVKDKGYSARAKDENTCLGFCLSMLDDIRNNKLETWSNETKRAKELLFERPLFHPDGLRTQVPSRGIFLPGAFNPIHDGHRTMAKNTQEHIKDDDAVTYAVTASAPHKDNLDLDQLLQKAAMFRCEKWNGTLRPFIFTKNDPLFLDKANQFPKSSFVIGADTALRMLDPKWGVETRKLIDEFKQLFTKFYVFDRKINDKIWSIFDVCKYYGLEFNSIFIRMKDVADISSTTLRKNHAGTY